jgi:hypothetical protein
MMRTEPVLWIALLTAIVDAAVVFGLDLDAAQKAALLTVIQALAAVLVRSKVTPA